MENSAWVFSNPVNGSRMKRDLEEENVMRPVIEIENLTKYYGKHRGIEHLNLVVDEGEFFGFIGPNGAGKSTTIRTILGLLRPQEGSVRILGRELGAGGGSKS